MLHELLLREALGLEHEDAERYVDYAKSVPDALAALGTRRLRARRVPQRHARGPGARDRRPGRGHAAEVDYFYPKLLTGLVYDALGD